MPEDKDQEDLKIINQDIIRAVDSSGVNGPDNSPAVQQSGVNAEIPVVSGQKNSNKRGKLKFIIIILALIAGAAGGYLFYKSQQKTDNTQSPVVQQNKDIEHLSIAIFDGEYGDLWPKTQNTVYSLIVSAQMFEGLVRYEDRNKVVPLLATDWSNPDANTWVFNLKPNVKFHNGNRLTAKDVKYSIETIKQVNQEIGPLVTQTIKSVEVVSDSKIKIVTNGADPILLNRLASLYIIDSRAKPSDEPSLAGTGPYKIKPGTKQTSTDIQLVAVDDYHGDRPMTRTARFGSEPSGDKLLKAFNDGKYNIVGDVTAAEAKKAPSAKQFITADPEIAYLGINTVKSGPLQKKPVREAIRYAVDPIKLAAAQGYSAKARNQIIPEEILGHNPTLPTYARDVSKSKQLLKEAGYPNGITIELSNYTLRHVEFEREITRQLGEANIKVKNVYLDDYDKYAAAIAGPAEMFYEIYISDFMDGADLLNHVTGVKANYDNTLLSEKLSKARDASDPKKRQELLQQASKLVDEEIPVIPLSARDNIWLMNKDYAIEQDIPNFYLSIYLANTHLK